MNIFELIIVFLSVIADKSKFKLKLKNSYRIFNCQVYFIIFSQLEIIEEFIGAGNHILSPLSFNNIKDFGIVSLLEPSILLKIMNIILYAQQRRHGYFSIPILICMPRIIFRLFNGWHYQCDLSKMCGKKLTHLKNREPLSRASFCLALNDLPIKISLLSSYSYLLRCFSLDLDRERLFSKSLR